MGIPTLRMPILWVCELSAGTKGQKSLDHADDQETDRDRNSDYGKSAEECELIVCVEHGLNGTERGGDPGHDLCPNLGNRTEHYYSPFCTSTTNEG